MLNEENSEDQRIDRPKRELSSFVAREMLYDFMSDALDSDRKKAMQEYLKNHKDLQHEFELMKSAESYTQQLARTKISPAYKAELIKIRPSGEAALMKFRWQSWPNAMKWATEAFLASVVVAIIALTIPWDKFDFAFLKHAKLTTLAELNPDETAAEIEKAELEAAAKLPDKKSAPPAPPQEADKEVAAKPVVAEAPPPEAAANQDKASASAPPVAAVASTASNTAPIKSPAEQSTSTVASSAGGKKATGLKGVLYKMDMSLVGSAAIAAMLKNKIIEMGGEKAGQVELGWRKTKPNGNYFHFIIPKSNYQKFITTLGGYGPVRIYTIPHPRVMPADQIRIILWIEDKKPEIQNDEEQKQEEQK